MAFQISTKRMGEQGSERVTHGQTIRQARFLLNTLKRA